MPPANGRVSAYRPERRKTPERLLHALHLTGNEGTAAVTRFQCAGCHQITIGGSHRHAAELQSFGEIALSGKGCTRLEKAFLNEAGQRQGQPLVERSRHRFVAQTAGIELRYQTGSIHGLTIEPI
ncbi:hypothetical protein AJ87_33950 [Rhizobium yanglingense]|nr:hypothetical protein AJ87_33950 [Rhizobium yanglingense]